MSARVIEIAVPVRAAGVLAPAVVLALSAGVTAILLLQDAHLAALIALSFLLMTAASHWFTRAGPRSGHIASHSTGAVDRVERLLLHPGGACEAANGLTRRQATLVSVFSAGALTALQIDCGGGRRRVVLWTAWWPPAQRSALGRWLTRVSSP